MCTARMKTAKNAKKKIFDFFLLSSPFARDFGFIHARISLKIEITGDRELVSGWAFGQCAERQVVKAGARVRVNSDSETTTVHISDIWFVSQQ